MKKTNVGILLVMSAALTLGACKSGGTQVFQPETMAATSPSHTEVEPPNGAMGVATGYDWEQVVENAAEVLNAYDYPLGKYLDYYVNEETKTIGLIWPLADEAKLEDAFKYMSDYIKVFNDCAYTQNYNLDKSTETTYGSLWNEYNLYLEAFREGDIVDVEKNLISQTIPAGQPIIIEEYVHDGAGSALELQTDEETDADTNESESSSNSSN